MLNKKEFNKFSEDVFKIYELCEALNLDTRTLDDGCTYFRCEDDCPLFDVYRWYKNYYKILDNLT